MPLSHRLVNHYGYATYTGTGINEPDYLGLCLYKSKVMFIIEYLRDKAN